MTAPSIGDFEQLFRTFRYSYFRLEVLQEYRESGEDEAIAAFNAGVSAPPYDPAQAEWEEMIRANRAANKVMQRVHVIVEPLTDYLRFELTWAYAPNVAAGEDVRIIDATRGWPVDVPRRDFHLFDSSLMFDGVYGPGGVWQGVRQVPDSAQIVAACRWREAALHYAQPWEAFIAARPALAARVPMAATA